MVKRVPQIRPQKKCNKSVTQRPAFWIVKSYIWFGAIDTIFLWQRDYYYSGTTIINYFINLPIIIHPCLKWDSNMGLHSSWELSCCIFDRSATMGVCWLNLFFTKLFCLAKQWCLPGLANLLLHAFFLSKAFFLHRKTI